MSILETFNLEPGGIIAWLIVGLIAGSGREGHEGEWLRHRR